MTDRDAVIGNPISQNKSALIHGRFAETARRTCVTPRPQGATASDMPPRRPNARAADGVGMLAEQAAEALAWWRGVRPDTRAAIEGLTVPPV